MLSKLSSSTNTVFSNYLSIAQFCVDLEHQRAPDECVILRWSVRASLPLQQAAVHTNMLLS